MKKTIIFTILCISLLLLAGCGEEKQVANRPSSSNPASDGSAETGPSGDSGSTSLGDKVTQAVGKYTGFPQWKEGMWAETVMESGPELITTRMDLIEINSDYVVFQMITRFSGDKRVGQMWLDADTKQPVKYVMDVNGKITCMDLGEMDESALPDDGKAYSSDMPGMKPGTYTTPTGKTVDVAIFNMGGSEVWVSSEVPFGMVKSVANGKQQMYLRDFGFSGAKSEFTVEQAENCQSMDDLANSMMADMGSVGVDEDVNYETDSYDYHGDQETMNCGECTSFPAGPPREMCLASCK